MALTSDGLTNGGITTHFVFLYDEELAGPGGMEPDRTNAVIEACEDDYDLMSGWFGGGISVTGMTVEVTNSSGGGEWNDDPTLTIQLHAEGKPYSNSAAYLRYLLVAEVTEIFMMNQDEGWFEENDEGSKGEGLSRFLSGRFLFEKSPQDVDILADFSVASLWLDSDERADFVNDAPDVNIPGPTTGCSILFIYYLFDQLGNPIEKIIGAGAPTLAGVYSNLTGDPDDPFPVFKDLLDKHFPPGTNQSIPGPNFDNPWPLG